MKKARAAEMRDEEDKAAVTAAQNQKEPRIVEITEDEKLPHLQLNQPHPLQQPLPKSF